MKFTDFNLTEYALTVSKLLSDYSISMIKIIVVIFFTLLFLSLSFNFLKDI